MVPGGCREKLGWAPRAVGKPEGSGAVLALPPASLRGLWSGQQLDRVYALGDI